MSDLTIVTFKWRGWRGDNYYRAKHVNVLQRMVAEHCSIPHRFVCITDDPVGIECETLPLWTMPPIDVIKRKPNCYARLRLFSKHMREELGDRVLQLDLDCILLQDIAPLITDDPFKIMYGKAAKYNGSMWQVRPGELDYVWSEFSSSAPQEIIDYGKRTKIKNFGSDQAWMSIKIPDAPMWTPADGCYHFSLLYPNAFAPGSTLVRRGKEPPGDARIIFFAGSMKPWIPDLALRSKTLYDVYHAYAGHTVEEV